jgi:alanine racemase
VAGFSRLILAMYREASIRPTRVEIDLAAARANAAAVARAAGTNVCAVVKADAYGHGAAPLARAFATADGVVGVAVALVEEGLELRAAGIDVPILLLGAALADAHREVVEADLLPMVSRATDLERFGVLGRARGARVAVHLKVDTGMTRLGFDADRVSEVICAAHAAGGVEITGICTHLASADEDRPNDPGSLTRLQRARFDRAVAAARAAGASVPVRHVANSAGALLFPDLGYELVRPGLALYGNGPRPATVALTPVMSLRSEVIALRAVAAGTPVSYGATWRAPGPSTLAAIPVGYADGYPRRLSGSAEVLIAGRRCPVVGRVCMDMILADVTQLGDTAHVGAEVVLLGAQGREHITAAELAERAGISEYEVTCGVSKRVPRLYSSP